MEKKIVYNSWEMTACGMCTKCTCRINLVELPKPKKIKISYINEMHSYYMEGFNHV